MRQLAKEFLRSPILKLSILGLFLFLTGCAHNNPPMEETAEAEPAIAVLEDDYPITDPYVATILGTPKDYQVQLADAPIQTRKIRPWIERHVPSVLKYAEPFEYTRALQKHPADLVFIIAGTGADAHSEKCKLLTKIIYARGHHVVCLPSPTSVNFMVNAAADPVPGNMPADVKALYAAMKQVRSDLNGKIKITGYSLAGYSLGATEAAYVARYDERQGGNEFNFQKTLLINPAVSLWDSVRAMDRLIDDNLVNGVNSVPAMMATLLANVKQLYQGDDQVQLDESLIFEAMLSDQADERQRRAAMGLAFRLSLANMSFAADMLSESGKIVPKSQLREKHLPLEPFLYTAFNLSFEQYVKQLLLPYWKKQEPVTLDELIRRDSLYAIGDWLKNNDSIAVITSQDDPILDERAVNFLLDTFGQRAQIFIHGGHMGNLASLPVVFYIQHYFNS